MTLDTGRRKTLDFPAINRAALQRLEALLREWLPDGRLVGCEYKAKNPTRADRRAGSFSININTSEWADFAVEPMPTGSDPISLHAYLFTGNDQGRSARELASRFGIGPPAAVGAMAPAEMPRKESRSAWRPIVPAPANTPEPPKAHIKRGRPQMVWRYAAADGSTLGYVYRFCTSNGGKEVLPLVWAKHATSGVEEWRWMAFPEPRPIYGLDRVGSE